MIDSTEVWIVIICLGLGSFALRFVFMGLVGGRPLPGWLVRHLRYTAVAVLPALVAPVVLWPAATGGAVNLPRICAALMAVGVGYYTKNMIAAILAGGGTLYLGLFLAG